jgi:four helix bundle protein
MIYKSFEDLPIFIESKNFVKDIYSIIPKFKRDYSLMGQLKRAAVSILLNIAEGFERKSNKEFANFVNIAKGSAGEVRAILTLAYELGYLDRDEYQNLHISVVNLSTQLYKFNCYLLRTYKKK